MVPKGRKSVEIIKKIVVDGFILCGLALCLVAISKLWKPFERGFFCGDQSLMYPYHEDTVTVEMLRIMGLLVPAVVFLFCERSCLRKERVVYQCFGVKIPLWLAGLYCIMMSYYMGYCFVELITESTKLVIGRLRPHFFDICQPTVDCSSPEYQGRYILSKEYHCDGRLTKHFIDMRKSFLSGHSAIAAYSMVYVAMYLQARMTWRCTRTLRRFLQFLVLMVSWYTALSRVSDYKHHWSDVLVGYSMGAILATVVWVWGTDLINSEKKSNPIEVHQNGQQSALPSVSEMYANNQQMSLPAAL